MRSIRIPGDRVGALVGKEGASKKLLEERTGIKIQVDKEGGVMIFDDADGFHDIHDLQGVYGQRIQPRQGHEDTR